MLLPYKAQPDSARLQAARAAGGQAFIAETHTAGKPCAS